MILNMFTGRPVEKRRCKATRTESRIGEKEVGWRHKVKSLKRACPLHTSTKKGKQKETAENDDETTGNDRKIPTEDAPSSSETDTKIRKEGRRQYTFREAKHASNAMKER